MLADSIARLIEEMLNEGDGILELQRNEMANRLGCVPSQISYVISSRFTPERGYIIESRRGGGGCIRIVRKQLSQHEYLMHAFCSIGSSIEEREAIAYLNNFLGNGFFSVEEAELACAAMSTAALATIPPALRSAVRADIFKQILLRKMASK